MMLLNKIPQSWEKLKLPEFMCVSYVPLSGSAAWKRLQKTFINILFINALTKTPLKSNTCLAERVHFSYKQM